jgi:hypothetical protein
MTSRLTARFHQFAPWGIVVFFILKAATTGLFVVRPWDVPDEVGHFSYIKDLATGKGFPVLHETKIDAVVWGAFATEVAVEPGGNWIAQHPPLYHLLMVPVYGFGTLVGPALWGPFYLIRVITAIFFGLGLWFSMRAFKEAGLSIEVSLGLGIMLGSIPNHTYLAGAVNHDALVFLFGTLVLYYWIRVCKEPSLANITKVGIALGLGGLVKYTFLVLFPPVIGLSLLVIWRHGANFWKPGIRLCCLSLVPIGLWAFRNIFTYGELLPVDLTGFQSEEPLQMSLLEFGRSFPVFSILIQTYWGLLGWIGDGNLQVRWLQIYSIYQQAYTVPLMVLFGLNLFYAITVAFRDRTRFLYGLDRVIIAMILLFLLDWLDEEYTLYWILIVVGIPALTWSISDHLFSRKMGKVDRLQEIEIGAVCVFCFFLIVHLYKIYTFTVSSGALQGTFGRYYLPVVGFLVVGFFSFGLKRFPWAGQLVLSFGILYGCTELYIWLHEAIPFFELYG